MHGCRTAIRRVLLGVLVAGAFSGVAAASASAFSENYCGFLLNEGTACSTVNGHTFYWNDVFYTGGGNLSTVCQDMVNSSGTRNGSSCAYNATEVTHNYGSSGTTTWRARGFFFDNGARHTIYGYAETP